MLITHDIRLDLVSPGILPPVAAVQGDTNTRQVRCALYAAGQPWEPPAGTNVVVRYRKGDGTTGCYDTLPDGSPAWSIDANTVSIILCPQMLTLAGRVLAQIVMIRGELELSTFDFPVSVTPDISGGNMASEDYVNWRGNFLAAPDGAAKVGDFLSIEEVDSNGRITRLKPADPPSNGAAVFDSFPDASSLAKIKAGDYFEIRGLATYRVSDTAAAFYVPYRGRYICPVGVTAAYRDIRADEYGIRRSAGSNYGAENSEIVAALVSTLTNGYTIIFGSGHYYFAEPIKAQKQDGTQLHMCIKGVCSNAAVVVDAVNYGTYLHFPDLADGQAAIDIPGGVVEDVGVVGNPSVCAMTLDRSKVITDPANAIKLTDNGTTYGIRAGEWGYSVHNVRIRNCTIGVWGETSNSIVDGVDTNQCKIGVSVGNDTKVRNVKAWHAMTAVQLRGQLASATNIRGDSIGGHLVECWAGKCLLSNIDGDFVLGSLIHYGDGTPRYMHMGQATGCMGRVATKLAYSRKGSFDLRVVPAVDYDKCSYISIAPYTQIFGGHIEVANAKANIYDAVSDYVHPDAPISIGAGSTVKGVTVVCNVPDGADLDYFNSRIIKSLSTNAQAENDTSGYLTDFDGKVIEDINFITPIGFVRSRRTLAAPERTLEFSKDANGALLVEKQALTEPQKAQVWKNLGLDGISSLAFVDSIDKCTDSAKTYVLPDGRTVAYAEKPSYTNKLPTSSDGAGGVYNAAETPGYSTGYVGGGGVVQTATKWSVTGFIPIRPNDVIRMQNLRFMETDTGVIASGDSKASFHFYDASYKYLLSSASYGPDNLPSTAWAPQYDATGNLVECKVPSSYNSAIRYMRLCVRSINADSIISVNEVIGPPTVEFGDTGLRFVTEEMYNKIIALLGA